MLPLKHKAILILIISWGNPVFGQSIINGYGLGHYQNDRDAASLGASTHGLIPAFQEGVSVNNPATWNRLLFTYLSGFYGGQEVLSSEGDIQQGRSQLNQGQLIVPIKQKYSWGMGFYPYSHQRLQLTGKSMETIIDGDTLSLLSRYVGSGGLSVVTTSFGFPVYGSTQAAFTMDLLFGSSRQADLLNIDETVYRRDHQAAYSGVLGKFHMAVNELSIRNRPLSLYLTLGFTLQPLAIRSVGYHPYEDVDNNGFYSRGYFNPFQSDFPEKIDSLRKPVVVRYKNTHAPREFDMGADVTIAKRWHLQMETLFWKDKGVVKGHSAVLGDQIESQTRLNMSIVKFSRINPRSWSDNLHFRWGIFHDRAGLKNSTDMIIENGTSLGIGFIFGPAGNQLDLGYAMGSRQFPSSYREKINRFSVGISIGDIWFVKRRSR